MTNRHKGIVETISIDGKDIRGYNIGESDYAKHKIQVWDIAVEYSLNFFDGSILKYLLRTKDNRRQDYEKIIHICQERIRQIDGETNGN